MEARRELLGPANLVPRLSIEAPRPGSDFVTYAFPENRVLDFADATSPPILSADVYAGKFLADVPANAQPFIPYPHLERASLLAPVQTILMYSIAVRLSAFRLGVGVSSPDATWDPLSSVLPESASFSPSKSGCAQVPTASWEYGRIPQNRRGQVLTFAELLAYGPINPPRSDAAG